jgi:hypothetical protein
MEKSFWPAELPWSATRLRMGGTSRETFFSPRSRHLWFYKHYEILY